MGKGPHRHHHSLGHRIGDRGPISHSLNAAASTAMSQSTVIPNLERAGLTPTNERSEHRRAFWGVMACFLVHGLVVSTWVSRIASVKSALHLGDGALGL